MKKIKSVHLLFIVLNVLGIAFEYFLLYKFFSSFSRFSNKDSLTVTIIILVIIAFVTVYSNVRSKKIFGDESKETPSEFQKSVVNGMKKKYYLLTKEKIDIKFIDASVQPSIMFALMGNVYINTNKRFSYKSINDVHFEGVLSHELGHIMHMPDIYMIANIRPTAILGNLLFILTYSYSKILSKKEKKVSNYFTFSVLYLLFLYFNIINLLILYPFKKYEELEADKLSLSFSNGYSLRGYYYKLYSQNHSKLDLFRFNFIDFNHPSPKVHYKRLKTLIGNEFSDCELVSRNHIKITNHHRVKDKNLKLQFYEKVVDKDIVSMYIYIGNLYLENNQIENAKKYYLMAGQNDILTGYRKLIKILKSENNTENIMEYYKILSKNGDREAKLYCNYYEQQFNLYKLHIDGKEVEDFSILGNDLPSITLYVNDTYIQKINDEINTGEIARRNKQFKISDDYVANREKEYYLSEGNIISKSYELYNKSTESYMKIKEYYKKMS